jgi:hypothetical protein
MGACYEEMILEDMSVDKVQQRWSEIKHQCAVDHGADAYNGTFGTIQSLQVVTQTFDGREAASEYAAENAQKWEYAIAARFKASKEQTVKEPTFEGKPKSEAANRWSHDDVLAPLKTMLFTGYEHDNSYRRVLCDQLSAARNRLIGEASDKAVASRKDYKDAFRRLQQLCRQAEDYDVDFPVVQWQEMKRLRKSLPKLKAKYDQLVAALRERDEKYSKSHCKSKTVDLGTKWLIGGWCSM